MEWRTDDESGRRVACGLGSGGQCRGFVLKWIRFTGTGGPVSGNFNDTYMVTKWTWWQVSLFLFPGLVIKTIRHQGQSILMLLLLQPQQCLFSYYNVGLTSFTTKIFFWGEIEWGWMDIFSGLRRIYICVLNSMEADCCWVHTITWLWWDNMTGSGEMTVMGTVCHGCFSYAAKERTCRYYIFS